MKINDNAVVATTVMLLITIGMIKWTEMFASACIVFEMDFIKASVLAVLAIMSVISTLITLHYASHIVENS